ncbi:hypothetical protein AB0D49_05700 [Streptomyces sp. NPDC048290]
MTTHHAPEPLTEPGRPVGPVVTAALVLAVLSGLGWIAGMIYTLMEWGF